MEQFNSTVAIADGSHLIPFRTQKLSHLAPTIVNAKIGSRWTKKNCLDMRQFFYWKNEWNLVILFEILVNFFGDLGSFNTNLT